MSQIRVPDDLFDLFIRFRNVLTNETSKQVNASNVPQRAVGILFVMDTSHLLLLLLLR